jgi:hypothetical protein
LYYVESASEFQYCSSTGLYVSIDLKGATGAGNKAIATISCSDVIFNAFSSSYRLSYKITIFSSGDIITSAILRGTDFGVTGTEYYASSQNGGNPNSIYYGVTTLPVDVYGVNNYGYFNVSLLSSTLNIYVEYYDSEMTSFGLSNPQTLTLTSTGCVRNIYTSRVGNRLFH